MTSDLGLPTSTRGRRGTAGLCRVGGPGGGWSKYGVWTPTEPGPGTRDRGSGEFTFYPRDGSHRQARRRPSSRKKCLGLWGA